MTNEELKACQKKSQDNFKWTHISIPSHGRSKSQRLGNMGSLPGMPEIYHSQAKKAIQETPVSTRSAIASLEDHENARLVSFKTATIKNEPAIIKSDPIISRLANERYEARVRNEGVC